MITLERGGNRCDIATIRPPLAFRCTSVGIGERNSESDITLVGKELDIYEIKNECLKYGRFVFFGQFDIHKVSFGIKWQV